MYLTPHDVASKYASHHAQAPVGKTVEAVSSEIPFAVTSYAVTCPSAFFDRSSAITRLWDLW